MRHKLSIVRRDERGKTKGMRRKREDERDETKEGRQTRKNRKTQLRNE
jgi:hypothetical protein